MLFLTGFPGEDWRLFSVFCCVNTWLFLVFCYFGVKVMRLFGYGALVALLLPALAQADEAKMGDVHDSPEVRGSIIANLLEKHDNAFLLYPYESNYVLYTDTSNMNTSAISSYSWADRAKKMN